MDLRKFAKMLINNEHPNENVLQLVREKTHPLLIEFYAGLALSLVEAQVICENVFQCDKIFPFSYDSVSFACDTIHRLIGDLFQRYDKIKSRLIDVRSPDGFEFGGECYQCASEAALLHCRSFADLRDLIHRYNLTTATRDQECIERLRRRVKTDNLHEFSHLDIPSFQEIREANRIIKRRRVERLSSQTPIMKQLTPSFPDVAPLLLVDERGIASPRPTKQPFAEHQLIEALRSGSLCQQLVRILWNKKDGVEQNVVAQELYQGNYSDCFRKISSLITHINKTARTKSYGLMIEVVGDYIKLTDISTTN